MDVSIAGLGNMGRAISVRLLSAGHNVHGFDPDRAAAEAFATAGGTSADSVAELGEASNIILLSLPGEAALEDVVSALEPVVGPDTVIVETSTLGIEPKRRAQDALRKSGATMLDAALSGTPESIRAGELAVYVSGSDDAYRSVEDTLLAFARSVRYVGAFGQAVTLKLICNLLVIINNAATAEAMSLASQAGLDKVLTHEVVSESFASSRVWDLRGGLMAVGDYRPGAGSYRIVEKDGALIDELAKESNAFVPLFELARQMHRAGKSKAADDPDAAALLELYAELSDG